MTFIRGLCLSREADCRQRCTLRGAARVRTELLLVPRSSAAGHCVVKQCYLFVSRKQLIVTKEIIGKLIWPVNARCSLRFFVVEGKTLR